MSHDKNLNVKSMLVNVTKSVTRMTKTGVGIQTKQIGRQCLDRLST